MLANRKQKDTFKKMINLCYEEQEFTELHREIISLENETKDNKETLKYETAMAQLLELIPLFTDDFPEETFIEIQKLYEEYFENN
jgi:hypothetical protein